MAVFICGVGIGIVLCYVFTLKRITDLEDQLQEEKEISEYAAKRLMIERKDRQEWQNVSKQPDAADLFKKW